MRQQQQIIVEVGLENIFKSFFVTDLLLLFLQFSSFFLCHRPVLKKNVVIYIYIIVIMLIFCINVEYSVTSKENIYRVAVKYMGRSSLF